MNTLAVHGERENAGRLCVYHFLGLGLETVGEARHSSVADSLQLVLAQQPRVLGHNTTLLLLYLLVVARGESDRAVGPVHLCHGNRVIISTYHSKPQIHALPTTLVSDPNPHSLSICLLDLDPEKEKKNEFLVRKRYPSHPLPKIIYFHFSQYVLFITPFAPICISFTYFAFTLPLNLFSLFLSLPPFHIFFQMTPPDLYLSWIRIRIRIKTSSRIRIQICNRAMRIQNIPYKLLSEHFRLSRWFFRTTDQNRLENILHCDLS